MSNARIMVIFATDDDRQYDRYLFAPPGVDFPDAEALAEKTIKALRDKQGDDLQPDDFEAALEAAGFTCVGAWMHSDVRLS